jgi:hypothetical protein
MLVFGGSTFGNDNWEYPLAEALSFSNLSPGGPFMVGRSSHSAVFDPETHRMLVFGGNVNVPGDPDVWGLQIPPLTLSAPPGSTNTGVRLGAAFPNPASGEVSIGWSLPSAMRTSLRIYDAAGRLVRTFADAVLPAGPHTTRWDRRTTSGDAVRPGLYFFELRAAGARHVQRVAVTE